MGHKVPWKIGVLICHPVTSRPLMSCRRKFYLPVTSRPSSPSYLACAPCVPLLRAGSISTVPSCRDPLHPFIFVFELITVTFTSPLHLINSREFFLGRCNRGPGARYWAVCAGWFKFQGPLNGGVSNGGVSRSGPVLPFCPFLFFLGLSWGYSRFVRGLSGIFPIGPFPLSRPIISTYEEQSRKGPRHNLDLSRKKWETPGFGKPPA